MMKRSKLVSVALLVLAVAAGAGCSSPEEKRQRRFEQAERYAAEGKYREAIIEYSVAVQIDPKFAQGRLRLATAYEKVGDVNRALGEVVRAADLLPEDDAVQLRAGNMLLSVRRNEDAVARARQVLQREPANVPALILLGRASAEVRESASALAMLERQVQALPDDPGLAESLGELHRGRGDHEAAEASFKRAITLAPDSLEPRQALAGYYFSVGRLDDAERTLKEAEPLAGDNIAVARDLAMLYFVSGRTAEAEETIQRVLAADPDEVRLRIALGDLYARTRRYDEAARTYASLATESSPTFAPASARTAYAEYLAGRKDAAYSRLENALTEMPDDTNLHTMKARLLLADRRFDESAAAAQDVLRREPDRFEALYVLGTIAVEQGRDDDAMPLLRRAVAAAPAAVGPKVQLGRLYLGAGDLRTALQFAEEAITAAPNEALPHLLLVRVLTAQGNAARAQQILAPLMKALPDSPEILAAAGDLGLLKNDLAAARREYEAAYAADPRSLLAVAGLAQLAVRENQGDRAVALVEKALAEHPDDPRFAWVAAETYLAVKQSAKAEAILRQAINSSQTSSFKAYGMLADLYYRAGRLDEAQREFSVMAEQQPGAVGPRTMLGIILELQGRPAEARTAYERVLQTTPDAAIAANNLAMLIVNTGGNLDMALSHAQTAKKAQPDNANINDTLGLVYLRKGLPSLAILPLEQSAAIDPRNAEFLLHLGQAYAGVGDKAKAREALGRAVAADPASKNAGEAKQALAALGSDT
jgi:tetratricopeptide (TPR) repeat protein